MSQNNLPPLQPEKNKFRVVDMDRINRLAASKSVPKKCGHKNCIPSEHWSHSKGKK